jgi:hypothetical protein
MPLIVQNAFHAKDTSVVTGATQFFRTIGGAIGSSVLGTVFNNQLTASLSQLPTLNMPAKLHAALSDPNVITSKTAIDQIMSHIPAVYLPILKPVIDTYLDLSKDSIAYAISVVFTVSMALGAIALVLFYLVPAQELKTNYGAETPKQGAESKAERESATVASS